MFTRRFERGGRQAVRPTVRHAVRIGSVNRRKRGQKQRPTFGIGSPGRSQAVSGPEGIGRDYG